MRKFCFKKRINFVRRKQLAVDIKNVGRTVGQGNFTQAFGVGIFIVNLVGKHFDFAVAEGGKFGRHDRFILKGDVVRGFLQISTASFAGCIKEKEDSTGNLQSRANELYLGFLDDLQKYCTLERSVEFYAGRRCVSTKYFTRQIKAASGKSPGRIIRERILIEAKALLNSTDLTVSQISEAMHFPNMSFFCRWFKMFSGLTPTGFRKKGYVETEVPM